MSVPAAARCVSGSLPVLPLPEFTEAILSLETIGMVAPLGLAVGSLLDAGHLAGLTMAEIRGLRPVLIHGLVEGLPCPLPPAPAVLLSDRTMLFRMALALRTRGSHRLSCRGLAVGTKVWRPQSSMTRRTVLSALALAFGMVATGGVHLSSFLEVRATSLCQ